MNLRRIFLNALARREAYVVVGFVLLALSALFGVGEARAQSSACDVPAAETTPMCADREQAYAAIKSRESWLFAAGGSCFNQPTTYTISHNAETARYGFGNRSSDGSATCRNALQRSFRAYPIGQDCPTGGEWNEETKTCSGQCTQGVQTPTFPSNIGAYRCPAGQCGQLASLCGPGSPTPGHVCWTNVGGARCGANEQCPEGYAMDLDLAMCFPIENCSPPEVKDPETGLCIQPLVCPEGQVKDQFGICKPSDNQCPAGQVKSPEGNCLPGDGQCATGEVRGKDGTCKKDSDNDGEPDEGEDDGTFEGGESCNAPPMCSGDNILCGQARIQWRIDCNTRKNAEIAGGQCGNVPVCSGDGCKALDYAVLLTTWRTACALEGMKDGTPGEGGQPAWTRVDGMSQDGGAGQTEADLQGVQEQEWTNQTDSSGWIGGSAIGIGPGGGGVLASGFLSVLASPPAIWVEYIAWIKMILISLTAVSCAFFIGRG